ncbi:MAG: alkaline phosphatase family protein [Elusimicrobia bacterium]|nr:alkaline phosphatase family protein [Elusimicrobiota bacterium]
MKKTCFNALSGIAAGLLGLFLAAHARAERVPPRLLLVISVDQMRGDYLERFRGEFKGGFKRLLEEGAWFSDAHHAHVPTETAPGHAVIMSGRYPSQMGIVGNKWFNPSTGEITENIEDSIFWKGPENFLRYNLADALKAKNGKSKVVAVSLKDRGAILMGGKKADLALWYEKSGGKFRTSSYYAPKTPEWVEKFNAQFLKVPSGQNAKDYFQSLILDPTGDQLLVDLAQKAVKEYALGSDADTDILTVSFSVMDYVGHSFGPDGPEMKKEILALDLKLAELLSFLEKRVGKERLYLALTSDHGVLPLVEELQKQGIPDARRVGVMEFVDVLEAEMQKRWPLPEDSKEKWILSLDMPNLYLNRVMAGKLNLDWSAFLTETAALAKSQPAIEETYSSIDLLLGRLPGNPYAAAYARSFLPSVSGDILLQPKQYVYLSDYPKGTGHGSPYPYDTHVPLLLWGPGIANKIFKDHALVADLAPTLGVLLGVNYPPTKGSRVLEEALSPAAP